MIIHGSCHCENLSFSLDWGSEAELIPARACQCSFCRLHGAVWTAVPEAALKIRVARPERVSAYAFGTRTADFLICSDCGGVPVVTSRIDGALYAVVNVKSFTDLDPARLSLASVSLEGEDESTRLARRKRSWIARVDFGPGQALDSSASRTRP